MIHIIIKRSEDKQYTYTARVEEDGPSWSDDFTTMPTIKTVLRIYEESK
jgi:hypothetical protein